MTALLLLVVMLVEANGLQSPEPTGFTTILFSALVVLAAIGDVRRATR